MGKNNDEWNNPKSDYSSADLFCGAGGKEKGISWF